MYISVLEPRLTEKQGFMASLVEFQSWLLGATIWIAYYSCGVFPGDEFISSLSVSPSLAVVLELGL